jgi:hypothetical protein
VVVRVVGVGVVVGFVEEAEEVAAGGRRRGDGHRAGVRVVRGGNE